MNRYGINEKTERAILPHGTAPRDILSLPEVSKLTDRGDQALRSFIAEICEVPEDTIDINRDAYEYIFKEIQKILSRTHPGLKIVRPNVTKNTYHKRMQ